MLYRARRAVRRAWFNFRCSSVLGTPAIPPGEDGITLVSMVCHGEVLMYLLAAKSFCRQFGRVPKIVVLDDGTLTEADRATLCSHLREVKIVSISSVDTHGCPRGSCWERLLLISQLVQNSFVVQLDCDTLTVDSINEVSRCVAENRSFTLLGDRSYSQVEAMVDACARLKDNPSGQVQAVCERNFDRLQESASLKYLRGNAGFTGFARGSIDWEKVGWFSDLMRSLVKDKWDEWGSEQVTSNLLIANSKDPYPLPAPKYLSYWAHPDIAYERSAFVHFIGPHRYDGGFYLQSAKQILRTLQ